MNQAGKHRLNRFMNWLLLKGKVQMGEKQSNLTIEMLLKEVDETGIQLPDDIKRAES